MSTRQKHPSFEAAQMAADDMKSVLDYIAKGEYGSFPSGQPDGRTQARNDRLDSAPDDIKILADQSYSKEFVDRLARLAENQK